MRITNLEKYQKNIHTKFLNIIAKENGKYRGYNL